MPKVNQSSDLRFMFKERIYKSISAEIRNKILKDGTVTIWGLGRFILERKAAREEVGEDGVIFIYPPVNLLNFEYYNNIEEAIFFDSLADRVAGNAQASAPFTREVMRELFGKIEGLQSGEYLKAVGLGWFLKSEAEMGFIPDDTLAREVNFEYAGQLAVRMSDGKPSYFVPKAPSIEDLLKGFTDVSDRELKPKAVLVKEKGKPKPESETKGEAQSEAEAKALNEQDNSSEPEAAAESEGVNQHPLTTQKEKNDKRADGQAVTADKKPALHSDDFIVIDDVPLFDESEKKSHKKQGASKPRTLWSKIAAVLAVSLLIGIVVYLLNMYGVISLGDGSRTVRTQNLTERPAFFTRPGANLGLEIEIERTRQELQRTNQQQQQQQTNGADTETHEESADKEIESQTQRTEPAFQDADESPEPAVPEVANEVPNIAQAVPAPPVPAPRSQPVQVADATSAGDPETGFGLRGTMQEFPSRPFGIVIHSLATEALARKELRVLESKGFRTTVYPITRADGVVSWRVSVGQFSSIEDAIQAAQTLEEPYRSNHFISRLPR